MSRQIGYVSGVRFQKRVELFTASGTFTPPAGVTYAIATIRAGGGGVGTSAGTGGTSSVAFAGGTVSATGGNPWAQNPTDNQGSRAGAANSGQGAFITNGRNDQTFTQSVGFGGDGALIVTGNSVTAGTGITVTVGAGGTAGTGGSAGGSGCVWIEYEQPIGAGL